jgi:hypothetical protein
MHKFLIYSSIYFCITCFELPFSPSSEAGVQICQWIKSAGYGVSAFRMQLSQSSSWSPLFQINLSSFHPMRAHTEDKVQIPSYNWHQMQVKRYVHSPTTLHRNKKKTILCGPPSRSECGVERKIFCSTEIRTPQLQVRSLFDITTLIRVLP